MTAPLSARLSATSSRLPSGDKASFCGQELRGPAPWVLDRCWTGGKVRTIGASAGGGTEMTRERVA